jgi:pimeloyl-ACP methyl ester carboxylesterase
MYVKIGGIDQWITIKGADRSNPVVLFLHGGPGDAMSPLADSFFPGWENEFTMVQWDQRGAGRTYTRNGKSIEPTMTVERMTDDGIEVAEYLRKHLHVRKIIPLGLSWGTVLGIRMAHARPDLFYAYVGIAQVTNWRQDIAASYAKLREIAQSKNDRPALDALNALEPPPWDSIEKWPPFRKVQRTYQAELATEPDPPFAVASEYDADLKNGVWQEADDFSFLHFWGKTLSGPLMHVDLTTLTDFKIPIFMVHGAEDLTIRPELARAYFKTIKAPRKEFYLVPGTGHNPSIKELEKLREVLLTQVRPMIVAK